MNTIIVDLRKWFRGRLTKHRVDRLTPLLRGPPVKRYADASRPVDLKGQDLPWSARSVDNVETGDWTRGEVVGLARPPTAAGPRRPRFYIIVGSSPGLNSGRVLLNDDEITDLPHVPPGPPVGISYLPQETLGFSAIDQRRKSTRGTGDAFR